MQGVLYVIPVLGLFDSPKGPYPHIENNWLYEHLLIHNLPTNAISSCSPCCLSDRLVPHSGSLNLWGHTYGQGIPSNPLIFNNYCDSVVQWTDSNLQSTLSRSSLLIPRPLSWIIGFFVKCIAQSPVFIYGFTSDKYWSSDHFCFLILSMIPTFEIDGMLSIAILLN